MPYHHFTQSERVMLSTLNQAGFKKSEIARQLNKHPSTIGRELKRNPANKRNGYHAVWAGRMRRRRRHKVNQRCRKLTFNRQLQHKIEQKLKRGWSPEQIAGITKEVSHVTIYRWVYTEREDLKKYLLQNCELLL